MNRTPGESAPPLRAGIIGCGNVMLRGHAPAVLALNDVTVAAIADPVEARLRQAQALLGLPDAACFRRHQDLLAAGVDYVTLTVPQKFRRPIVEDCARAGVHVLSEKPLAIAPAEAQAMINTMREASLRFGVVHNYLFYPEYVLARELIASGAIGQLRHVALKFLGMPDNPGAAEYRPQWRHDPAEAGGGILMDMVHAVYLAEFFLGGPLRSGMATVDNLDHPGEAVEDFTLVNYGADSGYASVSMWWGGGPGGLELSGTEGRLLVYYEDYGVGPFIGLSSFTLVNRDGRQEFNPRASQSPAGPAALDLPALPDTFALLHADFAGAVRAGRDPIAPAEAGLRALEAVLAAYMSAASGRVISLPLAQTHPVFQGGVTNLCHVATWADSPLRKRGVFGL
jgi:predicted dehydrogenase